MMRKRWHAIGLAVAVGIVTAATVGTSLGLGSIWFWTRELLALVLPRPLPDTMYWRVTEGVTVGIIAIAGAGAGSIGVRQGSLRHALRGWLLP